MSEAQSVVIGVLAGGFVTAGVQWLVARWAREDRKAEAAEARNDRREEMRLAHEDRRQEALIERRNDNLIRLGGALAVMRTEGWVTLQIAMEDAKQPSGPHGFRADAVMDNVSMGSVLRAVGSLRGLAALSGDAVIKEAVDDVIRSYNELTSVSGTGDDARLTLAWNKHMEHQDRVYDRIEGLLALTPY